MLLLYLLLYLLCVYKFLTFERFGNGKLKRKISDITINFHVVVPPESVYQGVQNRDDEDKCEHLNVDQDSVGAQ